MLARMTAPGMIALWIRPRGHTTGGTFIRVLNRPDDDPVLALTPSEARRLAAELTEHANAYDPPPAISRGRTAFGWRTAPRGYLIPDLEEQETIDLVVEHAREGYTRREGVDALNALGRKTREGYPWTVDTLRLLHLRLVRDGVLTESTTVPHQRWGFPPHKQAETLI